MTPFTPNTEGIWFNVPEHVYHAAPGISQSTLKRFAEEATPLHYQESLTRPREVTEDMELGTILHTAVLQPHLLPQAYYLQPVEYVDDKGKVKPWHGGANACKDWIAEHADRPIITMATLAKIPRIVARVMAHPIVGDIIRHGQKEVCIFKRDEETGELLKARLDAMAADGEGYTWALDLKKCRRGFARQEEFGWECRNRGYDIQVGSYQEISGVSRFLIIPMEDEPPYESKVWEISPYDIAQGYVKYRKFLHVYVAARAAGWPGYNHEIEMLTLPGK